VGDFAYLTLEGKIRFAWVMSDISETGVAGDATLASADKGAIILDRIADALAKALQEISTFEITDVKTRPEKSIDKGCS